MTWLMVVGGAGLLALRKPWALHTPQLWAEDGSIFLQQDDEVGARAMLAPYMGYLHTFPRLVAWFASHTVDVAWWPAIYNGAAFLATVVVFARIASPRVEVPGKPWLILAFACVAHSGEVWFNITNAQWITAVLLLLQPFLTRPANGLERTLDLGLLGLVGLTGPFAIVFWPLLAWRWWRERNGDTFAALLVVTACAAVQAWFIVKTGPRFEYQSAALHLDRFFAVVGNRLVIWPLLGATFAKALPLWAMAVSGGIFLTAVGAWVLRPHPRRLMRAQLLLGFGAVLIACVYRVRPDTWDPHDLHNGDRYFYLPRVLLAWLLVWEFDAMPRGVAITARALCGLGVLAQLPNYTLPALPNYHWAEHCDPIRRGVRANIYTLPEGWWIDYTGKKARP